MGSAIKFFFRNVFRDKVFTTLNILGLGVGMAAFILIMLWVSDELSYDKYNVNADRTLRIKMFFMFNGVEQTTASCPSPLAEALKNDFPEVEETVRLRNYGGATIKYNEKVFNEDNIIYADSTFFDVFTIPLIGGKVKGALAAPFTVALSESMAKKYFGSEDPVNKMLRFDNRNDYLVTAVYKDIPHASHFHFDFVASLYSYDEYKSRMWLDANFATYVRLQRNSPAATFDQKLSQVIEKYVAPQVVQGLHTSWDKILESGFKMAFSSQLITDIHLSPGITGGFEAGGDRKYIYIFTLIAVFIIVLACINFINLSTAKSSSRFKEIGVKKVYGIQRARLSIQFLLESLLIVFIAHIVAMILVEITLPYFNDLTGKSLSISYTDIGFIAGIFGLIVVVSLLAGTYPAIYLASIKPIAILKREMMSGRKKTSFRSILVVGQFTISIVLLSMSLLLGKQLHFIQDKNLGYDKEHLLVIKNTYLLGKNINHFKGQIETNPSIVSLTQSSFLPSPSSRNNSAIYPDGVLTEKPVFCTLFDVDFEYIKTFGMKMSKGREFSKDYSTDSTAIIINEAAAKLMGWEDPVGQKLGVAGITDPKTQSARLNVYTVLGVVKDFNYSSLHEPVAALAMFIGNSAGNITCRIKPQTDLPELISNIRSTWSENAPNQPFEYDFIGESVSRLYGADTRLGSILALFTGLAFFVSCLGLFGLALFTSEQRTKEIALRKVNGSGVIQIMWLLSVDFSKLILFSFAIACPVSWLLMNNWLEGFAYHTRVSWWIFVVTGAISYAIALISIGYLSHRAASANPVETLKKE